MFDIHSHILPGIDDGSRNVDMSIEMLREEVAQGVEGIVCTPHFYADSDTPKEFWDRRQRAVESLAARIGEVEGCPPIVLGAEVHFYVGMSRSESLRNLTMGNTDYILVEMPFRHWNRSFIQEIRDIGNNLRLQVIIAHLNRYMDRDKNLLEELIYDTGALIQVNAEAFIDRSSKRKMTKLLKDGQIDFLGSDCHNMADRAPNLEEAMRNIDPKLYAASHIEHNSKELFRNAGANI